VIGGLIVSTVLTLLIVPASFSLADGFEKWLGPKFGKLLTFKPGDDEQARHPGQPGYRASDHPDAVSPAE